MSEQEVRSPARNRKPRNWFVFGVGSFMLGALLVIVFTPAAFGQSTGQSPAAQDQAMFGTLQNVYRFILNNYVDQVDPMVLYDGALKGMFEALKDPHTAFLDVGEMRSLNDTTTGQFGGLGMYIDKQRDAEGSLVPNGFVEVVAPIEETPAWRAGMLPGDLIAEIDGVSTTDVSIDEALAKLRGNPGTPVKLRVFRGKSIDLNVPLVREIIEIPTVKYGMIGTVAYLRLIQFTPKSTERVHEALVALKKQNYSALIIDLRNNPGGVLDGAVEIGDLFFSDGTIVSTRGRIESENEVFEAKPGQDVDANVPMIVLMNGGSASASEILGGALKDRSRALFIGEKSYGKGSVQTVRSLGDRGFRLTIARYYTPANISIDKVGISPDIEVTEPPLTRDEELAFIHLREKALITNFVQANKTPSAAQIQAFVRSLPGQGIQLPELLVKRLVQREIERQNNVSPVYDLEYDTVLQKALEVIKSGKVAELIKARPKTAATPATATGRTLPSPKVP